MQVVFKNIIRLLLWFFTVALFITNLLIMGFYDRFAISFSINRSINYKFAISITKRRYSMHSIHNDKTNDRAIFRPTEQSYG